MKSNIRVYENACAPLSPAEQMRDVLRRSSSRYAYSVSDPFGTGDVFDIFRAIFDSPVTSIPDKPLINWLINYESNNVYPYDYYVDTEHSVSDKNSILEKVIHTFEIPVAGFKQSDINVSTIPGKLRVTLGNPNYNKDETQPEVVYSDIDELGTKTNTRYYIKRAIKRNFVELLWNVKGLKTENVSSNIVNGILRINVVINIDNGEKEKNMWSTIQVGGSTQNEQ